MSNCSTHAFDVPLKSCPFCGGEAKKCHVTQLWEPRNSYWVKCKNCRISGTHHTTEAEAIAAWNSRAERTCHRVDVNGYSFRFECSLCGYVAIVQNCETRLDELPNYCPNCGARVVS